MKRNTFGINLDEGIALTTPEEFDSLFVDTGSDAELKLGQWLREGEKPVLLGGQIGCGKTTLIEHVYHMSQIRPDMIFHFDHGSLNLSDTDSWSIVFSEVFRWFASTGLADTDEIPGAFKDILGQTPEVWRESIGQIRLKSFTQEALDKSRRFSSLLDEYKKHLPLFLDNLIKIAGSSKQGTPILFASGLDKFEPGTAAYFSLHEILSVLSKYKTLFEVNIVHLFSKEPWMRGLERVTIPVFELNAIEEMLIKRLGRYVQAYASEIPLLAEYSGGVPRQALRLLDSFKAVQKGKPDKLEAFYQAVGNVNRDFFAFSQRPENTLMESVNRDKFLETDLISLPGDKETAMRAVFGNWILLNSSIRETRWQAKVNPLIRDSFFGIHPDEPERVLLKEYARQKGISDVGLDVDLRRTGWQNTLIDEIETPIEMNLTEVLEAVSSALLSKDRADRIIVAYEDKTVCDAVRAYLEAQSNTYEYQVWAHHAIREDGQASPLQQMIRHLQDNAIDVHSFDLGGDLRKESLDELNLRRDSFAPVQLIWWVPKNRLNAYLSRWTQLRQFFQVFVLEEDLAKVLRIEDIESDLAFIRDLVEAEETAHFLYVKNLEIVLKYLRGVVHG